MNFKTKAIAGSLCVRAILLNKKTPVFLSWAITERCNLQCKYCHAWRNKSPELSTDEVLKIIEGFSLRGTKIIKFTGGEPLLRDDITELLNCAHDVGMASILSTNGILFPEKADEIKKLDTVSISLDGPQDIHDYIRGKDSHQKVLEALKVAKKKKTSITISTTLNSLNVRSIGYVLSIAEKFDAKVFFQPATRRVLYGEEPNPVTPDIKEYRAAILSLMESKKRNKWIGNSMAGLRHLSHWPDKTVIACVGGKIICTLDSRGNINPCSRFTMQNNELNLIGRGIEYCLHKMYSPACGNCWCSSLVELNMISKFNVSALVNAIRM